MTLYIQYIGLRNACYNPIITDSVSDNIHFRNALSKLHQRPKLYDLFTVVIVTKFKDDISDRQIDRVTNRSQQSYSFTC